MMLGELPLTWSNPKVKIPGGITQIGPLYGAFIQRRPWQLNILKLIMQAILNYHYHIIDLGIVKESS
jgi:hypothetical protein